MLRIALVVSSLALFVSTAHAAKPDVDALSATPQRLLEALDKRHNDYPTQHWTFEMNVQARGGEVRSMTFEVWQKGSKRMVRFLSPGEVKGMSVLNKGGDAMWVYSSETGGKARRVSASARRQNLLGSDMTYEDMAQVDLSPIWNATVDKKGAGEVWMKLAKKPDAQSGWSALRIKINKKDAMIQNIEYFDGGKVVKVQSRSNFGVVDGVPVYQTIKMLDKSSGHSTTLKMLTQKIGENIPDKFFSKRTLIRGN
ncbi:MAG: outer membrane lipoprotein-sorting protein [Myxococcota bacterium]|jgi:outer membrane lipoprotein-sorting protein